MNGEERSLWSICSFVKFFPDLISLSHALLIFGRAIHFIYLISCFSDNFFLVLFLLWSYLFCHAGIIAYTTY